jgi:hypothetical protein
MVVRHASSDILENKRENGVQDSALLEWENYLLESTVLSGQKIPHFKLLPKLTI